MEPVDGIGSAACGEAVSEAARHPLSPILKNLWRGTLREKRHCLLAMPPADTASSTTAVAAAAAAATLTRAWHGTGPVSWVFLGFRRRAGSRAW